MNYTEVLNHLLLAKEPMLRWKLISKVFKKKLSESDKAIQMHEISSSAVLTALLYGRESDGKLPPVGNVYHKWCGAHWVMATLADLGYPVGDESLNPIRDQLYEEWLSPNMRRMIECTAKQVYRVKGVPVIEGRARRCASQQGNALYAICELGLADELTHTFAELLLKWQWPDGGWNCDKNPTADTSSFMESLTPLRGLIAYNKVFPGKIDPSIIEKAASVFLERKLFRRRSDNEIIHPDFIKLHYPCYWHYDILFGLKVMAEGGFINHPGCQEALDILEEKVLPGGGWATEDKYYRSPKAGQNLTLFHYDRYDWSAGGKKQMNEWLTADALYVLSEAGRLELYER